MSADIDDLDLELAGIDDGGNNAPNVIEVVPELGPCVEWTGGRSAGGYGYFKDQYVHRIVAESIYGGTNGKVVMHRCDNKPCFNSNHLKVATQGDNIRDAFAKGIISFKKKTHCKHGHELSGDNVYYRKRAAGGRACVECKRRSCRDYRARKKKANA